MRTAKPDAGSAKRTPIITSGEAAKLVGISEQTLRERANVGLIPAVRLGHQWRYHEDSVRAFLEAETAVRGGLPLPAAPDLCLTAKEVFTTEEASAFLRLSLSTFEPLRRSGRFPHRRAGRIEVPESGLVHLFVEADTQARRALVATVDKERAGNK